MNLFQRKIAVQCSLGTVLFVDDTSAVVDIARKPTTDGMPKKPTWLNGRPKEPQVCSIVHEDNICTQAVAPPSNTCAGGDFDNCSLRASRFFGMMCSWCGRAD